MSSALRRRTPRSLFHRMIIWSLGLLTVIALCIGVFLYFAIMRPNVWLADEDSISIYLPSGSDFEDVKKTLYSQGIIINHFTFEWLADQKKYPDLVKPGHYVIHRGMNNDQLINMLRSGEQTPVNVTFNSLRDIPAMARIVSLQIEADSASLAAAALDPLFLEEQGLDAANASVLYIPNTYEFWWTTDATGFRERMVKEFEAYWDEEKRKSARELDLTVSEVVTLASIVEKETVKNDEKQSIAGVYINRLKKGWRLQADPTLVYAAADPTMKRVLNIHKEIDSPYNTYRYYGLPPGPICIPSTTSIEAVLHYRDHDYMFFCARDDLSGYHVFSRTLREHNRHARAYQNALNERKVMK